MLLRPFLLLFLCLQLHAALPCVDVLLILKQKTESLDLLKGTFEGGIPLKPTSFAAKFPDIYQRIMRLFDDRPSYLMGINRRRPLVAGMEFGQIIRNIHQYAHHIGEDLGHILKDLPLDFYARDLLFQYVTRFQVPTTKLANITDKFDPTSQEHLDGITRYGSATIDSIWSEIRVAMRLENISWVSVSASKLVKEGWLDSLPANVEGNQEIDHVWYPLTPDGSYSVAIGETKVFEKPFDNQFNRKSRKRVYDQMERYLTLASMMGAKRGMPAQLHYFFVAGISNSQMARLQEITQAFNHRIAGLHSANHVPVELFIFGNYE